MRRTLDIPLADVAPTREALLRALGVPRDRTPGERVEQVLAEALEEFQAAVEPRGMYAELTAGEFAEIYEGDGRNEVPSPLPEIFPRAEVLALFAATVGSRISDRIAILFDDGRAALATTLDVAASEGVELAGARLDRAALDDARSEGKAGAATRILRYSPGYCGWDLTGQRALFAALAPEAIGVRLLDSCLMEPLKSISGAMVMGPAEIHDFENDYRFCSDCRTKDCRARMGAMRTAESRGDEDGHPGTDRR